MQTQRIRCNSWLDGESGHRTGNPVSTKGSLRLKARGVLQSPPWISVLHAGRTKPDIKTARQVQKIGNVGTLLGFLWDFRAKSQA